jgi:hypothetical protein
LNDLIIEVKIDGTCRISGRSFSERPNGTDHLEDRNRQEDNITWIINKQEGKIKNRLI